MYLEIGEGDFQLEVLESRQPTLVLFWAAWSRPCQVLGPVLEDVSIACGGRVRIVKVDADANPDLSLCYDVQSIPALLYFVNGELCDRLIGTVSKEVILARLQPFLALPRAAGGPEGGGRGCRAGSRDKDHE